MPIASSSSSVVAVALPATMSRATCIGAACSSIEEEAEGKAGDISTANKVKATQLENELRKAWKRPVLDTATPKDLGRLATRIDINLWNADKSGKHPNAKRAREEKRIKQQKSLLEGVKISDLESVDKTSMVQPDRRKEHIERTVRALGAYFDEEDRAELGITAARSAHPEGSGPDLRPYCDALLHGLGQDNSKIVRVLKCCHQNILFIAIVELKTSVLREIMTRDNRDEDGWRIKINLEEKRVQIAHVRKEHIVEPSISSGATLTWEVCLTFDTEMLEMDSTSLRLSGMAFEPGVSPSDRQRLSRALSYGSLIIR